MRHGYLFGIGVSLLAIMGRAEVPNASPENLRSGSTHIIVGKVQAVYKSEERTDA